MTVMARVGNQDLEEAVVAMVVEAGRFACDIETSGLDPKVDRIGTVQLHAPGAGTIILRVDSRPPRRLCQIMEDPRVLKVFHHAMFDLRFMVQHWKIAPAAIACTKIGSKLANPSASNEQHTLKSLLLERLGVSISKDYRLSDWLAADLTDNQLRYAAADVEHLLALYDELRRDLEEKRLLDLYEKCISFIPGRVQLDLGGWNDVFSY